jgi:PhzF family phenazine biosynthesis protein
VSRGAAPYGVTAERTGHARHEPLAGPHAWLYSSFTDGFSSGNPAGVVVSPAPLSDPVAQAVATFLCAPKPGFLFAPEPGADTVAVRFFTPEREIDGCGHVMIAVAAALVEHGIWSWGDDVIVCTRGGEFPLHLRDGATAITQRLRLLEPALVGWEDVTATLGAVARYPSLPLGVAGTGLRHLIVPLAPGAQFATLELDAARVAALARKAGVDTICVATTSAAPARVRDPCAALGALEEPASGTTVAALALYLAGRGALEARPSW